MAAFCATSITLSSALRPVAHQLYATYFRGEVASYPLSIYELKMSIIIHQFSTEVSGEARLNDRKSLQLLPQSNILIGSALLQIRLSWPSYET